MATEKQHGIVRDDRGEGQPVDKERAQHAVKTNNVPKDPRKTKPCGRGQRS